MIDVTVKNRTCLHCGRQVRGLKNAPEIAIHVLGERRMCNIPIYAEFADMGPSTIIPEERQDNDVFIPSSEKVVLDWLTDSLRVLRINKPNERGERARRYAVTITEMEKVIGYFKTYVFEALEE